jgi:hypothetical protein
MDKMLLYSLIFLLLPALAFTFMARTDPLKPIRSMPVTDPQSGVRSTVYIDDSTATFQLEVPEDITEETTQGKNEKITDPLLYPDFITAADNADYIVLPSFELCGERGKFFDDGAYAAVELQLEKGLKALEGGKVAFLTRLYQQLANKESQASDVVKGAYHRALVFATAGLILSNPDGTPPAELNISKALLKEAQAKIDEFRKKPLYSKPLGFYNWSPELQTIFTRDRFLMTKLDTSKMEELTLVLALTDAVATDTVLSAEHDFVVNLYSRLTNPPSVLSTTEIESVAPDCAAVLADSAKLEQLRVKLNPSPDASPQEFALFPPSRSKEVDLANKLGGIPLLQGNLMDLLIQYIKEGKISLAPTTDSGWYEYQQFALECFLKPQETPEGSKLIMNEGYIKRLEEAFRSMLTQARETHVKQLDYGKETSAMPPQFKIDVSPNLLLEPMPTYYLRVAQGYGFLNWVLESNLGKETLANMYGLREKGKADESLDKELASIRELFYGFYLEACMDIGLTPQPLTEKSLDPGKAIDRAEKWLGDWRSDPLMAQDIRVVVPMGPTGEDSLNCWCVLGIRPLVVNVNYQNLPTITCDNPQAHLNVNYSSQTYSILVPVFAEVVVPGETPYTREEFRALCDKYKTKEKIIKALEKGEGLSSNPTDSPLEGGFFRGLPNWVVIMVGVVIGLLVIAGAVGLIVKKRRKKDE